MSRSRMAYYGYERKRICENEKEDIISYKILLYFLFRKDHISGHTIRILITKMYKSEMNGLVSWEDTSQASKDTAIHIYIIYFN